MQEKSLKPMQHSYYQNSNYTDTMPAHFPPSAIILHYTNSSKSSSSSPSSIFRGLYTPPRIPVDSTWSPCGIPGLHGLHMESIGNFFGFATTQIPNSIGIYSTWIPWNSHRIPGWNKFHVESTRINPSRIHGIHVE